LFVYINSSQNIFPESLVNYFTNVWFISVIPATPEAEIRRIAIQGQAEQKARSHLNQQAGIVGCACNFSYAEGISERIMVIPGKKYVRPYPKK
jgi:hypothetical protein